MLPRALLLGVSIASIGALADPLGGVEIDLVFPKSKTYTIPPNTTFPLVWAVRNSQLAKFIGGQIEYQVSTFPTEETSIVHLHTTLVQQNETEYINYVGVNVHKLVDEGAYTLFWILESLPCDRGLHFGNGTANRQQFTLQFNITNQGGEIPDLVTAAQDCTDRPGQAYNIKSTGKIEGTNFSCANPDDIEPFPPPDPCGLPLDRVALNNMTKALAAEATRVKCFQPNPTISCPANGTRYLTVGILLWLPIVALFL